MRLAWNPDLVLRLSRKVSGNVEALSRLQWPLLYGYSTFPLTTMTFIPSLHLDV
jgi:hypothetical protein